MIPQAGEVYIHQDGSRIEIREVDLSSTMEVTRVEFVVGTAVCEANAAGWRELAPMLTRYVEKAQPEPRLPRLDLIRPITPSLKMLQALEKEFAMGVGDVEMGYIWREPVVVLVARGDMAETLKEIGLRLHKEILEQKKNHGQDPKEN